MPGDPGRDASVMSSERTAQHAPDGADGADGADAVSCPDGASGELAGLSGAAREGVRTGDGFRLEVYPASGDRRALYLTGRGQDMQRRDVPPSQVRRVAGEALALAREFAAADDAVWALALADGEEIRAAAAALYADFPQELAQVAAARPVIHVSCSRADRYGWEIRAVLSPGLESPGGFLTAVSGPAVVHFRARDGRETRDVLTRRHLAERLKGARVPVIYRDDPR